MDGLIINKCQSCDDDANLFCRMCKMHFCPDHACLHLSVAQSSYTERMKNDNNNILEIPKQSNEQRQILVQDQLQTVQQDSPLHKLSETTLRNLYQQSIENARKYRAELERRAAPFERTYFGEALTKQIKAVKQPKVRGMAKSKVMALEYLRAQIKAGNLDAALIMEKLNAQN